MPYNPSRLGGKRAPKRRNHNPHAGVKHSSIMARGGPQAVFSSELQNRVPTSCGWKIAQFLGDDFEVEYHYICAGNNSGVIKNEESDRFIRVLAGTIFLTLGSEIVQIYTNQTFSIKKGCEYQLATPGVGDAEVLFCQGPKYEEGMDQVSPPEASNIIEAAPIAVSTSSVSKPRREESKALEQAEMIKAQRNQRKKTPMKSTKAPLAGQQVTGVNPRPAGPGGYAE